MTSERHPWEVAGKRGARRGVDFFVHGLPSGDEAKELVRKLVDRLDDPGWR